MPGDGIMINNQANSLAISAEPHSIIINNYECNSGKNQQEKHNIKSLPSQDICDSLKSNSDSCNSLRNIKRGSFRKINLTSISSSSSTSSYRSDGDQADIDDNDDDDFSCSSPVCINQSDNDEAVYNDDISFCSSSRSCIMTGKYTASKESPTLISNREESIKIDQSSLKNSINSISNDIIDDRDKNPKDAAAGGYRSCDETSVGVTVCRDLRNLKDIAPSHCYSSSSKCSSSSSTLNSHNCNLSDDQARINTDSRVSQDDVCIHCGKCTRKTKINLNKGEDDIERSSSYHSCCSSSGSLYSCNCTKCCCCCSDCDNLKHSGVAPASSSSISSQQGQASKSGGLHRHRPCRRHRKYHKQRDNIKSIL